MDGRRPGLHGPALLKPQIDLDELVELVTLPDPMFPWGLEIATGELYPGPDDFAELVPLPQLTESQILEWMAVFAAQATEPRIQILLTEALKETAPEDRFREILSVNPQASARWSNYFDQKRRAILVDWLNSLGLGPDSEGD